MSTIFFMLLIFLLQVFAREYPGMKHQVADPNIADKCFSTPRCNFKYQYRTIDGSCNNVKSPNWGKADTAMVRLLPANYHNGISSLRRSKTNESLPNARDVSIQMFCNKEHPMKTFSAFLTPYAQMVAHDTSFSAAPSGVSCCPNGKPIENDNCASISLSASDPFYGQFNRTCMEIIRTRTTKTVNCKIKPVQQLSQVTHFHDISILYGSNDKLARSLRTLNGGFMKSTTSEGKQFCIHAPKNLCDPRSDVCYKSGDVRVNQNLPLTVIQTMCLREHNRLAKELHNLNPSWNDEKLYQEARRINIAQIQHITYYEFLPLITGSLWAESRSSKRQKPRSDYSKYDPRVNPSTINEFTASCFRLLHSIVTDTHDFMTEDGVTTDKIPLKEWWERPILVQTNMPDLLNGLCKQPSEKLDTSFAPGINLFTEKQIKPFGDDLEAIDIQRSRDHGLSTYTELRHLCGGKKANQFSDLENDISKERIDKLKKLYSSVEDIDLPLGALLEKKAPYALIGPTCNCVIQEQFRRWKVGDRFWYEHEGQIGSFTESQLNEIRNASLARLVCGTGDVTHVQRFAFWQVSEDGNPVIPCSEIATVSLHPWKS